MHTDNNTRPLALIIDDEPTLCELLAITLTRMDIDHKIAYNIATAKKLLPQHNFNLCLTDMQLPDGNGLQLIEFIQQHWPQIPVAMITAYGTIDTALQALKNGAFDFITKPLNLHNLRKTISSAINLSVFTNTKTKAEDILLGNSKAMIDLRANIEKLSRSQAPTLITGPSGSGKELVARLIHQLGPRHNQNFIAVNCGAIPEDLLESELFGYTKGSFTGANQDKPGLFQAANGGTLFLDEIGELPLNMQVKLLRALQDKRIRPIGSTTEISVDIRILSATHQDLNNKISLDKFREDLYYRINVIEITVPSLAARKEDIILLAENFLQNLSQRNKKPLAKLSDCAINALTNYSFPGNVRELENILERAFTLCDKNLILTENLQLPFSSNINKTSFTPGEQKLTLYMHNIEKNAIVSALEQTQGNQTAAAKLLGVTLRVLRYRIKKLNISTQVPS